MGLVLAVLAVTLRSTFVPPATVAGRLNHCVPPPQATLYDLYPAPEVSFSVCTVPFEGVRVTSVLSSFSVGSGALTVTVCIFAGSDLLTMLNDPEVAPAASVTV